MESPYHSFHIRSIPSSSSPDTVLSCRPRFWQVFNNRPYSPVQEPYIVRETKSMNSLVRHSPHVSTVPDHPRLRSGSSRQRPPPLPPPHSRAEPQPQPQPRPRQLSTSTATHSPLPEQAPAP
ncbi:hypothetical protein K431DRAFT_10795 [Polychaeton citri CBS 116435]|uniref:Uncharacterized protein n=1 Tax=Polychaeton citri CBS 116435 TaxID=1314669 RepID=A0A9P4USS5_9PEZI|nr:hypothetical protein K431DRAFT_10795 [Polychaeton citri CBS 116435]